MQPVQAMMVGRLATHLQENALSLISPNMHIINSKCVKDLIIIYMNLLFPIMFCN